MTRVAITGGLGFIGSHLAEAFAGLGWEVLVIDDCRGNVVMPPGATKPGLNPLPPHVQTIDPRYIEGADVLEGIQHAYDDVENWAEMVFTLPGRIDLVVHCAAPVGPGAVASMGGQIALDIITATHAIAVLCQRYRIPLVNISSSEVYGVEECDDTGPIHELGHAKEDWAIGHDGAFTARSEYGLAKATAENMIANMRDLQSCSVRPFNTAGPRQASSKGFVLPTFIEQVKRGEKLSLYEPTAVRSFTHVHDVCWFIARHWRDICGQGGAWNVASPYNAIMIGDLAQMVCNVHIEKTGSDAHWELVDPVERWGSEYAFFGRRNGAKVPNADKAMALGWEPEVRLRGIVEDTYGRTS